MKRSILAIFYCAFLLANAPSAWADPVFDQDMASRYLRVAQSGDDEAQFYLGALYSAGIGVPRSDEEALRWLSRAADQGHSHAMLILSGLYATGRGVEKDNIKAYKWAYIVNSGSRVDEFRNGSRQLIGVLESRMNPDQINAAKAEASQWRPVVKSKPGRATTPIALAPSTLTSAAPISPAPALAASSSQPPAQTSSNQSSGSLDALSKNIRKGDVDSILDQVPSGLRKRFGF